MQQQQLAYDVSQRPWTRWLASLGVVSFGEVTVVPMLGEVLWVRWWQQCIATTTCGVLQKVLVTALGTSG